MTSLLTIGTFDLFHAGHVDFLRSCSYLASHVTVAVNPDEFVEEFKGRRPVVAIGDRLAVVNACKYVNAVMIGSGKDSSRAIEVWLRGVDHPRILAIGGDWLGRDYLGQLEIDDDFLRFKGVTLVYIHSLNDLHSSEIRNRE